MARAKRRSALIGPAAALVALAFLAVAVRARGADRIYWVNQGSNTISFSNVDGTEGGTFNTGGVPVSQPAGLAIDTSGQRLFWVNRGTQRIAFASLSGAGGENFETGELAVEQPHGLAIDPTGERVYWINHESVFGGGDRLSFAFLDGSFGGIFTTIGAATLGQATGVAVDPAAGRLYWTNGLGGNAVSFLDLDGTGGGNVNAQGADDDIPSGVAVDPVHGRVYWTNFQATGFPGGDPNAISYANLDGSGGGNLPTGAATIANPTGLAVDPIGGRVYWVNQNGAGPAHTVSYANLDGSGGGDLPLAAPVSQPAFPVLYFEPRSTAPPKVGGQGGVGSPLSCSQGEWAPDIVASFLYESPTSFTYQWLREGLEIPGATASTFLPTVAGPYTCRVTARNLAGQTARTSAALQVHPVAFGKRTQVSLKLASPRISAAGLLAVRVTNGNEFTVSGKLAGADGKRKLPARAFKVAASGQATVRLALPGALRALLAHGKRVSVALTATVADLSGAQRTVKAKVVPKAGK